MPAGMYPRPSLRERLWRRVEIPAEALPGLDGIGHCWIWLGARQSAGYGHLSNGRGGLILAHRAAWILSGRKLPAGKDLCHRCDTPACVRPSHLFVGSRADNMQDAVRKGRTRNGAMMKTQCLRGHPLFGKNLFRERSGARVCRECRRRRKRKRRQRGDSTVYE